MFKKSFFRTTLFVFLITNISNTVAAQNRSSIWCFGDSAGIDFSNLSNPSFIHSACKSRGSAASISDSIGQLLLYSSYNHEALFGGPVDYNGEVYNRIHQRMPNGDQVITEAWYNEQVIIPDPANNHLYYLFSINVTGGLGLFYSKVDIILNGGLGDVTQKNIQLLPYKAIDCLYAIKHGNGRDWWVIFRRADINNNEFYFFLIDPSGISGPFIQSIGEIEGNGTYSIVFCPANNKFIYTCYGGLIEEYLFDRCTGILSNYRLIYDNTTGSFTPEFVGAALSPNGKYLYRSSNGYYSPIVLIQFNLEDSLPMQTADTLFTDTVPQGGGGFLRLAPDGKIYYATAWDDGFNFNYPYPDTLHNQYTDYIGVINSPDSLGAACNFQPYSFYLGGARNYYGFPNNPDYELGPVVGSVCDSLHVGISPTTLKSEAVLHTYYHSGWQMAFVNASGLQGRKFLLTITDVTGRIVYKEESQITNGYFTSDIRCENFASGVYIVSLSTEKEKLSRKFVRE
ncbi:MAG: hypothetical protein RIQ89_1786 [Bacteroidota bacterium]|jgi:hypothetical protein